MNTEEKKNIEEEKGYDISGADPSLVDKANSSFIASSDVTQKETAKDIALNKYTEIASNDNIVSDKTWNKINRTFKTPTAVTEADEYLKGQLSKIQSGKTSYTDQIKDMMSQIQNRDKFSYDVDSDPLFQQALASAMNSGRSAMQDAIGQASALTGGYGSTYATSAANQAYNSFIEDAYDNLPQYYQMALEAYQMEGDEMYRQLDMLNTADSTEYGRMLNAYDATYAHRNQMYNEAYTQHQDSVSNAISSANLQISEHNQLSNDAFNLYSAYSNEANTTYNREYQQWSDSIDNAWKMISAQNSDYWANENYNQAEDHFTRNLEHDSEENRLNREWQSNEALLERNWKTTEAEKDRAFTATENALNRTSKGEEQSVQFSDSEIETLKEVFMKAGGGEKGNAAVYEHLKAKGKDNISDEQQKMLESIFNSMTIPEWYQNWAMYDAEGNLLEGAKDTTNHFGGDDNNDVYTNGLKTATYKELGKLLHQSKLSDREKAMLESYWKMQSKK